LANKYVFTKAFQIIDISSYLILWRYVVARIVHIELAAPEENKIKCDLEKNWQ
jgi:hypothetical protein